MSLAGHGINGFKRNMEMVCGQLGALRVSNVTTFSGRRAVSVMINGPIKPGWILLAFCMVAGSAACARLFLSWVVIAIASTGGVI
uniref:Uncharacterized protein n=1 Tax=Romanomermis culicivorax TaxID=13658 RepID=A0A915HQK8_ROMCU